MDAAASIDSCPSLLLCECTVRTVHTHYVCPWKTGGGEEEIRRARPFVHGGDAGLSICVYLCFFRLEIYPSMYSYCNLSLSLFRPMDETVSKADGRQFVPRVDRERPQTTPASLLGSGERERRAKNLKRRHTISVSLSLSPSRQRNRQRRIISDEGGQTKGFVAQMRRDALGAKLKSRTFVYPCPRKISERVELELFVFPVRRSIRTCTATYRSCKC